MMQLLPPEAETLLKSSGGKFVLLDVTLVTAIHPVYPFSHINGGYQRWRSFRKAFKRHCNSIGFAIIPVGAAYVEIR
ncbi:hypothetical protein P4576_17450 [Peribacillus frigoritolerans]|uniref:hypothetical protein n=1 Tax=Peribacillus frigoritolerans TaxID=450367 RepID=UPI002E1D7C8F|nr:hypothetical protein [Peribacillus frigoritolerans]